MTEVYDTEANAPPKSDDEVMRETIDDMLRQMHAGRKPGRRFINPMYMYAEDSFNVLALATRMTLDNRMSVFYTGKVRIYVRPHLRTFAHCVVEE